MTEARSSLADRYAELLPQIAAGDRAAEGRLIELLGPPIAAILRNRARGDEMVDDLKHEALLVVLKATREARIPDVPRLIAFAGETARRLALNAERLSQRRRTAPDHDAVSLVTDDGRSVDRAFEQPRMAACVNEVLASLNCERDRRVLIEYYLSEQSTEQLQSTLAVNAMQLGRILYRARQRFEAAWRARRFEEPGDDN